MTLLSYFLVFQAKTAYFIFACTFVPYTHQLKYFVLLTLLIRCWLSKAARLRGNGVFFFFVFCEKIFVSFSTVGISVEIDIPYVPWCIYNWPSTLFWNSGKTLKSLWSSNQKNLRKCLHICRSLYYVIKTI